jgi:hypothetical protein
LPLPAAIGLTDSYLRKEEFVPSIPCDLDIARAAQLKPIADVARALGIEEDELELYGRYKAKISLSLLE